MSFKYWVYISAGLFVAGMAAGLIVSATAPEGIVGLLSNEMMALEELTETFGPFKGTTAVFIFFKNTSTLLFGLIFGPLLCLVPFLTLVFNGMLLSYVSVFVAREISLGLVLAAILPHGILEIPAIVIGEAAALYLGMSLIVAVLLPEKRAGLMPVVKKCLRYFVIAVILLVPAAVIETFVTPLLVQRLVP